MRLIRGLNRGSQCNRAFRLRSVHTIEEDMAPWSRRADAKKSAAAAAAAGATDVEETSTEDASVPVTGTRRSLFPPLWQRFKDQMEDPSGGALPEESGANVTLDDLAKL